MLELSKEAALHPHDAIALQQIITEILKPRMKVVEVGSWKGYSASIMGEKIQSVDGYLYCVDHWGGISGFYEEANERDVFRIFRNNMVELGLWQNPIHVLYTNSLTAAQIFQDEILDLVFIDADHRYECVRGDILAWMPKLKIGGVMCGHDYYNPTNPNAGHVGVTRAMDEILGRDYEALGHSIWKHIKTGGEWLG